MRRQRDPSSVVRMADALAAFAVIVALRETFPDADAGFEFLVVLPVLFLAVRGSRGEVVAGVVLAVLALAVPALLAGEAERPAAEWAVIALVAGVGGWLVQSVTAAHRESEANLAAVAEVTRSMHRDEDPRLAVCRATCRVSGASVAMLAEPDGEGGLVLTANLGGDVPLGDRVDLDDDSGAAVAYSTGQRLFAADLPEATSFAQGFAGRGLVASALWQPVLAGARVVAVLIVGWERRIARPSDRAVRIIALLGAEAASAIERDVLIESARTDPLTGVLNERAWTDEIPRELARARRAGSPLCLALLDVEGEPGDRALKEMVAGWSAALRPADRLARLFEDQFAIVLPGCAADDACRVLERVRAVRPEGVTSCVGLAEWDGREAPDALVGRAGSALEEARRTGPDRLVRA
ncbi:MAG TPA: sensor domain-containing diguanylate cyclase [Solirubrobacteraceae bacterium]